jgi:hypothetical protein
MSGHKLRIDTGGVDDSEAGDQNDQDGAPDPSRRAPSDRTKNFERRLSEPRTY